MQDACFHFEVIPNCDAIAQSVAEFLTCDLCMVLVVAADGFVAVGLSDPHRDRALAIPRSDPLLSAALASHGMLKLPDVAHHQDMAGRGLARDLDIQSFVGLPLRRADGEAVGVLCAIGHAPRLWRASDVQHLAVVGDLLQARIDLHLMQREQDALSMALMENDALLTALSGLRGKALTVQNAQGDLIFASRAVALELGFDDRDMLALPEIARAVAGRAPTENDGTVETVAQLPGRGRVRLAVQVSRQPDGFLLADWRVCPTD